MTTDALLHTCLSKIQSQHYEDRPREFYRDRPALLKALARWGHECTMRNWLFNADFILKDILELLSKLDRQTITYLPVYLHEAIGRRIGQRAEELQAAAKKTTGQFAAKIVDGTQKVAIVEKSDTEVLSTLYAHLARKQRPQKRESRQMKLL